MSSFNALYSPYENLRPKSFFGVRKAQISDTIIKSNGGKQYNPKWKLGKRLKSRITENYDVNLKELGIIIPWTIAITMIIINIF